MIGLREFLRSSSFFNLAHSSWLYIDSPRGNWHVTHAHSNKLTMYRSVYMQSYYCLILCLRWLLRKERWPYLEINAPEDRVPNHLGCTCFVNSAEEIKKEGQILKHIYFAILLVRRTSWSLSRKMIRSHRESISQIRHVQTARFSATCYLNVERCPLNILEHRRRSFFVVVDELKIHFKSRHLPTSVRLWAHMSYFRSQMIKLFPRSGFIINHNLIYIFWQQ